MNGYVRHSATKRASFITVTNLNRTKHNAVRVCHHPLRSTSALNTLEVTSCGCSSSAVTIPVAALISDHVFCWFNSQVNREFELGPVHRPDVENMNIIQVSQGKLDQLCGGFDGDVITTHDHASWTMTMTHGHHRFAVIATAKKCHIDAGTLGAFWRQLNAMHSAQRSATKMIYSYRHR